MRLHPGPVAIVVLLGAAPLAAQEFSAGLGYASVTGRIGDFNSNKGPAIRLGINFPSGAHVSFGIEGGLDFFDQARYTATQSCLLPGGGTDQCFFDSRYRDQGRSLSGQVRFILPGERLSPYLMLGLGILSTRTHTKSRATDSQGNDLPNFATDGHSSDDAIQGPIGAGLVIGARGARMRLVVEGRATPLLHNYSGGMQFDVGKSATLGLWFRP
jgi:hypothetical protein